MPNGILAFRRDPGKISIYFDLDSTNFRLFRPDPISRFDPNPGGFFRFGSNPSRAISVLNIIKKNTTNIRSTRPINSNTSNNFSDISDFS